MLRQHRRRGAIDEPITVMTRTPTSRSADPAPDASASQRPQRPVVTVAVPMRNEAGYIDRCLASFAAQTWPYELLDVLVIDAGSTDGSREFVDEFAKDHAWVRVVDNPVGSAAAAFNIGMHQANGDTVCLFSSHGVADPRYCEAGVTALLESGASGVGGQYHHVGEDPRSMAIGLAMVSPVGMASPHRFASERKDVDTISHPMYWRDAMLSIGDFDERLARNSDYEFNHRMTEAGHRLIFDPTVESIYRPRPNLAALSRQFWHYGRWKARVAEAHPSSIRGRHLVAPAAVTGAALSPALVASGRMGRLSVAAAALGYLGVIGFGVRHARPTEHGADPLVLAAAFPTMHASWGAGFVATVLQRLFGRST